MINYTIQPTPMCFLEITPDQFSDHEQTRSFAANLDEE